MSSPTPQLEDLLVAHRGVLVALLERESGGLRRYESAEDLAQDVHLRALREAEAFRYEGEAPFRAWLFRVARNHVAERHAYWTALKRGSARALRLSLGATTFSSGVTPPEAPITGPSTFAERRELLVLATKALASLPARDAQLVRWRSEGMELELQADHLELSYAAAQRAGLRAVERFRQAFELVRRASVREETGRSHGRSG
ncbi:MAG: sigma-70 family RNA polymerase sigma factor [Planctomycetota bacterium]